MSNLRLTGLASGMDTDLMVQSLMKVERMKVDKFEQSKQVALWRQEAYNNMNKLFANFILNTKKDMGLTKFTSTGISMGVSLSRLDYVKKAIASDETKANVSVTAEAVNGNFELDVKSLANNAAFTSQKITENEDVNFQFNVGSEDEPVFIDIDVKKKGTLDETMAAVAKEINSQKYKVFNGKAISDEDYANLTEAQKTTVKEESLGISAFYDKANQKLTLQANTTGEGAKIDIRGDYAGKLGFNGMDESSYTDSEAKYISGKDAKVLLNGAEFKYSTNNFTLNGVNIELKDVGKVKINVETNVEGIMDKIKKLVEDYNDLVDKVSGSVNEKKYSGYYPLSSEEKKAMKEDDVKLWDEKARSGLLSRDGTLSGILQKVRVELYEKVEGLGGSFNHLTQIGIATEKYSRGAAGGRLEIDEEKLRAAILDDPEGVMELLFNEDKDTPENNGVFTKVYDKIIDGMKSIIDKSGPGQDADLLRNVRSNILIDFVTSKSSISDLDKDVLNFNKRIDEMNAMLIRKEDAYYAKFGNMEKLLQQMYSQSSWLAQQTMM